MRLARAALRAALEAPGVVGSDPGTSGVWVTADPPAGPLIGVFATAQADGRYAVGLSLIADMVPLQELAEQVRERVRKRARGEQLEEALGSIDVDFAYVMTAEEIAAGAAEREVEETLAAEQLAQAAVAAQTAEPAVPEPSPSERAAEALTAQEGAESQASGMAEPSAASDEATLAEQEAAAIAVRQAALATDQAALAAKQAALAVEQAALAGGSGEVPGAAEERQQ